MYKNLYFKITIILIVFIIAVMCVVGTFLLNRIFNFFKNEFLEQMQDRFSTDSELYTDLLDVMKKNEEYWNALSDTLKSYSSWLGINNSRNYYILDLNGGMLAGSNAKQGENLKKTPNMIAAMNAQTGNKSSDSNEYSDYAVYMSDGERDCIIYIIDTLEDTQKLSSILFQIILQSLMFGLIAAILLAFFLSKAITMPIQNLTHSAQLVADGDFEHQIEVHSNDEIGILTDTFKHMKIVLKNTIDEVSGERQKLETVFSYLKDAVIAFDNEGKILHINQSAKELFGGKYSDEFEFRTMLLLLSLEYSADAAENADGDNPAVEPSQTAGAALFGESSVMTAVYDNRVLEVNFGDIKYTQGGAARDGTITVIHDITSRYELDKSRREFVANVSHELRTPLTSIKGACETILTSGEMPDEIRDDFLMMAINESDRMTNIIRDLLILSRLDNKKTQWKVSSFNINESIRHICEVIRMDAAARGHEITFDACAEMGEIKADKERIDQVVINVLSNAVKYTPDGGRINIKTECIPDGARIKIADNGIGIPEEDIPRLFERFYRVEKARTSDTGGTGLGLAIAKEIIEAHGGTISITSKLEHGSEVIIELPRTAAPSLGAVNEQQERT